MHKHYFGIASLLLTGACLIWSIGQATAFPQGSNSSLGSNPGFSYFSSSCTAGEVIATVPADQVLIITDIISAIEDGNDIIEFTTSTATLGNFRVDQHNTGYSSGSSHRTMNNAHYKLNSGIVVPSSESLTLSCSSNLVTITGYYAHP